MEIRVERVLRKGKKSARILLSSGETLVLPIESLPEEGSIFSVTTSDDKTTTLRPLTHEDEYPSQLRL